MIIDELDKKLLDLLQRNAKIKMTELAEKLGKPRTTVMSRVERLEREGIIRFYKAIIDPEKFGFTILAFVLISVKRIGPSGGKSSQIILVEKILKDSDEDPSLPWVEEAHIITGAYDIILKVWAKDMRQLSHFLINYLPSHPEVMRSETMLVLEKICESRDRTLPISKI